MHMHIAQDLTLFSCDKCHRTSYKCHGSELFINDIQKTYRWCTRTLREHILQTAATLVEFK